VLILFIYIDSCVLFRVIEYFYILHLYKRFFKVHILHSQFLPFLGNEPMTLALQAPTLLFELLESF